MAASSKCSFLAFRTPADATEFDLSNIGHNPRQATPKSDFLDGFARERLYSIICRLCHTGALGIGAMKVRCSLSVLLGQGTTFLVHLRSAASLTSGCRWVLPGSWHRCNSGLVCMLCLWSRAGLPGLPSRATFASAIFVALRLLAMSFTLWFDCPHFSDDTGSVSCPLSGC